MKLAELIKQKELEDLKDFYWEQIRDDCSEQAEIEILGKRLQDINIFRQLLFPPWFFHYEKLKNRQLELFYNHWNLMLKEVENEKNKND